MPARQLYIKPAPLTIYLPFLSSYLPCCEWADHEGPSSDEVSCIAQRGGTLSLIAFGHLGDAIFDVFQLMAYCLLLPTIFISLLSVCDRESGEDMFRDMMLLSCLTGALLSRG